jgi:hypothetical protein
MFYNALNAIVLSEKGCQIPFLDGAPSCAGLLHLLSLDGCGRESLHMRLSRPILKCQDSSLTIEK